MRFLVVMLLAAMCRRISKAPLRIEATASAVDTVRDTLVFTAKLYDTIRLQNTQLITRFDTQTQTIRMTQVLTVPVVRDTVRQILTIPQLQEKRIPDESKAKWSWNPWLIVILVVLLFLLYAGLRIFVF